MKKSHSGFTVIELFVVVFVLAVLVALAMFAFQGAMDRARDAQRLTELQHYAVGIADAARDNAVLCTADGSSLCRAGLMLDECRLYDGSCNGDSASDVTEKYLGDIQLRDPLWTLPCEDGRRTDCGYTFSRFESIADFEVAFSTHDDAISDIASSREHVMSQNGEIN